MICLCCGRPLQNGTTVNGWHKNCVKRFFGTARFPEIEIDNNMLEILAKESTDQGFTVPGVQKKISLHLLSDKEKPRLTLVNYPTGYILKPQVTEFESLPEAEHLIMCMAEMAKISTVPHALIKGKEGLAYITKRIDRIFSENEQIKMLAMEDFCQLDHRLTQDKYRGSYERCAKIIQKYSSRRGLDMTEFFIRIVFSFIVGNSDMHLKNFSLIETDEGSGEFILSPAYDMLPVNVIVPEDEEQFALPMNGKKTNIRRKDFLIFADECGISRPSAEKMIDSLIALVPKFLTMTETSMLPEGLKEKLKELITVRASVFSVDRT